MWRKLVGAVVPEHKLFPPASLEEIESAGKAIGTLLPSDLTALLLETDGVFGSYELGMVWPVERIARENVEFRSSTNLRRLYMSFDSLLFFGDAGNGDQFAFAVVDGQVRREDIYAWNHEDDSRVWVAPSLQKYFEWSVAGKIKL
ncbi:SMI1/KNR4 family protein [Methyloversatilis sp.]|uniref:SMI1/KNR4 family protein n=1 Tax=Methyloversatilis sp. TaxID=2569862 RepID=UPI0035B11DF1